MTLADAAAPQGPWWLVLAGIAGTALVAFLAAYGPVWLEKIKARNAGADAKIQAKGNVASAEDVLREWLKATIRERDRALKEVERLEKRIDVLEKELIKHGWDGQGP